MHFGAHIDNPEGRRAYLLMKGGATAAASFVNMRYASVLPKPVKRPKLLRGMLGMPQTWNGAT